MKIFNRTPDGDEPDDQPQDASQPVDTAVQLDPPQTAARALSGRQIYAAVSAPPASGPDMSYDVSNGELVAPTPDESGVHALPDPTVVTGQRVDCTTCQGRGYVIKTTSDLLRESIDLVGPIADDIVRDFYTKLLAAAPDLAQLFPPDLLDADETDHQRDKLLAALVALATEYEPRDVERMQRLAVKLEAFGRHHAAFDRPDGSTRGATMYEYGVVGNLLLACLAEAAGHAWTIAHSHAWLTVYEWAADVMHHAQMDYLDQAAAQGIDLFPRRRRA